MTSKTASMNEAGTASWKRSDMELTNTTRGSRHFRGCWSKCSCRVTVNPALGTWRLPSHEASPTSVRRSSSCSPR